MKTRNGKNRMRDLYANDISSMVLGTGTTTPSEGDTAVEGEDASTSATPTITKGEKVVRAKHILYSTVSAGTDYNKIGIKVNDDSVVDDTVIFPTYSHTANSELHTTMTTRWK